MGTASAPLPRSEIVPAADHHVHLLGPYALPLPDPPPPEVELPPALTRLLQARAQLTGNVSAEADLDAVFAEDAQLLDAYINHSGWMRDRYWFMRYINLAPPGSRRRYVPNAFHVAGGAGYIAGTVLDVPRAYHLENFVIAVRDEGRDDWRIASEASTPTTPPRYRQPRIPLVVAMKINIGDAGVDFRDASHVTKVRRLFDAANAHGVALIVHLEPGRFYGPAEVDFFLDSIASRAPDITIQIAHLAGNGPGITSPEALAAFAEAREAGDPRTRNLYFDFAGLVYRGMGEREAALMAQRMRQIGLDRILFASDASPGTTANPSAAEQWSETRRLLPLTDEELLVVARNLPPYIPASAVRSPD